MKVALCTIAKLENRYIRDFVIYYMKLGIDHITIYDNNDPNSEKIDPVISDLIRKGFVDIIDVRGKKAYQMKAYEEYFKNNYDKYDWICYFDVDEYLYLVHDKNIKDYLSRPIFREYEIIHINWKIFDDNDLLLYENIPVYKRFTRVATVKGKFGKDFPENDHIKSIIRTTINKNQKFPNPHTIKGDDFSVCDNAGNKVKNEPFVHPANWKLAEIRHYQCKTIEEFCEIRLTRGRATTNGTHKIDQFKTLNQWTKDKEEIYNDFINLKNIQKWKEKIRIRLTTNQSKNHQQTKSLNEITNHSTNTVVISQNSNMKDTKNSRKITVIKM